MANFIETCIGSHCNRYGGFLDTDQITDIFIFRNSKSRTVRVKAGDGIEVWTKDSESFWLYEFPKYGPPYRTVLDDMTEETLLEFQRNLCIQILTLIAHPNIELVRHGRELGRMVIYSSEIEEIVKAELDKIGYSLQGKK